MRSRSQGIRTFLGVLLAWILHPSGLQGAAYSSIPRSDFPVPESSVNALLESEGTLYLGGSFSRLDQNTVHQPAAWDTSGLEPIRGLPNLNGDIYAVAADYAGGAYLLGTFTRADNLARPGAVRIARDGRIDPDWKPQLNGLNFATARLVGRKLYIAGFLRAHFENGELLYKIVLPVDAETGLDAGPGLTGDNEADTLVTLGNTLFVGGRFTVIGGVVRTNLAAIDLETDQVLPWTAKLPFPAPGLLRLAAVDCDRVYVTSERYSAQGEPTTTLFALDPVSGESVGWGSKSLPRLTVGQVVLTQGRIYIIGSGAELYGRGGVMALDAATGGRIPFRAYLPEGQPQSGVLGGDGALYVAGIFNKPGGGAEQAVYRIDVETGQTSRLPGNPLFGRFGFSYAAERLYATATRSEGTVPRGGLAAIDMRTGDILPWSPHINSGEAICLARVGDQILVGGFYFNLNGAPRNSLASVDRRTGALLDWAPSTFQQTPPVVGSLAVISNTVYVGGYFTNFGGQARSHLAAVDRVTGQLKPWNPGADERVSTIAVAGSRLLIGGYFRNVSGSPRTGIAALDPETGALTDWRAPTLEFSPFAPYVRSIAVGSDTVYLSGAFTRVNGQARVSAAAFDLVSGALRPWNPVAQPEINALELFDGRVYAAGCGIGGRALSSVGDLDPTTGQPSGWAPAFTRLGLSTLTECAHGTALLATPGALYAAGVWDKVDDRYQPMLAVFPRQGAPRVTQPPQPVNLASGGRLSLSATATGAGLLAYQWEFNGVPIAGATGASMTIDAATAAQSGDYRLIVTNELGYTRSAAATVTVFEPPILTLQPQAADVQPGETIRVTVGATGSPPPVFQWRRNGVNIPGARQPSLVLSNATPADGGYFEVVIANAGGARTIAAGPVRVRVADLAFSDSFAAAPSLPAVAGIVSGDNAAATRESGEPLHDEQLGGRTVWVRFHAPTNGVLVLNTRGSAFDSILAVYSGATLAELVPLASDDDQGGFLTSETACTVATDGLYHIAIDAVGGRGGPAILEWRFETAAGEAPRLLIAPVDATAPFGGVARFQAIATAGEPLSYQWLLNDCSAIPGATNDTLVLTNVGPADVGRYTAVISTRSRVLIVPAVQLEIALANQKASTDKFPVPTVPAAPAPGGFAGKARPTPVRPAGFASVSAGIPGFQLLNTFGATTEAGEPNHAGVLGGASRWLRLQPSTDGVLRLDTTGSQIDTVIAVYQGDRLSDLRAVASDDNGAPDRVRSVVQLTVKANESYLVALDGAGGVGGAITLNWLLGTLPEIRINPLSQQGAPGQALSLLAEISGSPTPRVQWWINGMPLGSATNPVLSLPSLQWGNAGLYTATASNLLGTVSSQAALVRLDAGIPMSLTLGTQPGLDGWSVTAAGLTHPTVSVQFSTNLIDWSVLYTTNATSASPVLRLPWALDAPLGSRFFRLVQP